jgi:TctA family transporter
MPVFEILPLEAIGPARLGASRTAAREAMSVSGFQLSAPMAASIISANLQSSLSTAQAMKSSS